MSDTTNATPVVEAGSAPVAAAATSAWTTYITPFATAIGSDPAKVADALKGLIGEPNDDAVGLLQSDEFTSFDDVKACFPGVPVAKLKKAVSNLRAKPAAETSVSAVDAGSAFGRTFSVLPIPPDNASWLAALKASGDLKIDQATVISAVRAGLAHRVGLYDLPNLLVDRMEAYAESLNEPVGADYYKLRKLLTRRTYAEIFQALEIESGSGVTQAAKTKLIGRLETYLWPALIGFQNQLNDWSKAWQQGMSNPALMMAAVAGLAGGKGLALAPGMMQPPGGDGLRDAAESVIVQINKVFAGTGVMVARALAYDAHCIRSVLENSLLPAQVGAANKEVMLNMLNTTAEPSDGRLETNLTQYTMAIMDLPKVPGGEAESNYLGGLFILGSQIPWDKLSVPPRRTNTASARRSSMHDE